MRLFKFQTLVAAFVCSFTLCAHVAVPAAEAGLLAFLGRHLLGSSPHHQRRRVVYRRRSVHSTIAHRPSVANGKKTVANPIASPQQTAGSFVPQQPAPHQPELVPQGPNAANAAVLSQSIPTLYHPISHGQEAYSSVQPPTRQPVYYQPANGQQWSANRYSVGESRVGAQKIYSVPAERYRRRFSRQTIAYPSFTEPNAQQYRISPTHARATQRPNPVAFSAPFRDNENVLPAAAPMLSKVAQSTPTNPVRITRRPIESNDQAFSTRASWYGPGFEGRRTASGARFNEYGLTAASRTLPLGSKVLVANPTSGRCCTVTINDRGPYVAGRDIDLSRGAASRIGVTGVSPVICVAYANPQDGASGAASSGGQGASSGRHTSRHHRIARTSGQPAKISGKVMHLVAGIS